jgi:outer membrane biosynthesis protein TonB
LPLALLIVAVLAAGIVTAFLKADDQGREVAEPTPTATAPEPTDIPTPPEPTDVVPTDVPTPEPTEEPTEEPSPEPTEDGGNGKGGNGNGKNGNGDTDPLLADTGGVVLPWLLGGALLSAGGAGLWRLRRRPDQAA